MCQSMHFGLNIGCNIQCTVMYKCIQDHKAGDKQKCNTIEFLKFIPTITCCSPKDAISHIPHNKSSVAMSCYVAKYNNMIFSDAFYCDEKEILSDHYQRPYQYLVRLSDPTAVQQLDTYTFSKSPQTTYGVNNFLNVVLK